MTLMGLLAYDENVLKNNFHLPDFFNKELKDTLLEHIVFECAELEIVVSDPVWFGRILDAWSFIMKPQWEYYLKWKLAQDENTKEDINGGKTTKKNSKRTPELETTITGTISDSAENYRTISNSAYNQTTYNPSEQINDEVTKITDTSGNTKYSGIENYESTEYETGTFGVRDIETIFKNGYINIGNIICTDFKERFCLMVY